MRLKLWLGGMVAVLFALVPGAAAQDGPPTPVPTAQIIGGDDPDALRALVERLFIPGFNLPGGETQIIVGALPDNLEDVIVLPDDAQVLGTIYDPVNEIAQIYAATDLDPDAALAFFDEAYYDVETDDQRPTGPQTDPVSEFCLDDDFVLTAVATPGATGGSDLLVLHRPFEEYYPPCSDTMPSPYNEDFPPMPALELTPSEDARVTTSSTSSGPGSYATTSRLEGELTAGDTANRYGALFEDEGWIPLDSFDGVMSVRVFTITYEGRNWQAVLTVSPVEDGVLVLVQVNALE